MLLLVCSGSQTVSFKLSSRDRPVGVSASAALDSAMSERAPATMVVSGSTFTPFDRSDRVTPPTIAALHGPCGGANATAVTS